MRVSRSRRAGDPARSGRKPYPRRNGAIGPYCLIVVVVVVMVMGRVPRRSGAVGPYCFVVGMMMMVTGRVPWPTINGNLVPGHDDLSQQLAPIRRCVGGTVARTVGEVRTVVHDDVLAVSVEFGQDALFSMRVTGAVPVAGAIVVLAMCHLYALYHNDFPVGRWVIRAFAGDGLFMATSASRRRRGSARRFRVISGISAREIEARKLARVGDGTLRAAGREIPFDGRRMVEGRIIRHGGCGFRYGLARSRIARDELTRAVSLEVTRSAFELRVKELRESDGMDTWKET